MTISTNKSIMILDEDPAFCRIYQSILRRAEYDVLMTPGRKNGLDLLKKENPQAVFIEIKINGSSEEGIRFIEEVLQERPNLTIIVVSKEDDPLIIMKVLKQGVFHYLIKETTSLDHIEPRIQRILKKIESDTHLKESIEKEGGLVVVPGKMIIGKSQEMYHAYELIQKVADNRSSALILGETGTGKELVARAIHALKGERTPFIPINCGCFQKTLVESELFGIRKKYAGMHNEEKQIGKLEAAEDGTLLLDEIGTMEVDLQMKLLRVLEDREIWPLGCVKPVPFRAQIIASTNADLESAIKEGRFRNDLYYRLSVEKIVLPPLRQRKEDIPLLVEDYLDRHEKQSGDKIEIFPETMDKLMEYHWPGNIRELFNTLGQVMSRYPSGYLIPEYFDSLRSKPLTGQTQTVPVDPLFSASASGSKSASNQIKKNNQGTYKERLAEFQKLTLLAALEENGWNQTLAAKQLDLNRPYFSELMNKLGIKSEMLLRLTQHNQIPEG